MSQSPLIIYVPGMLPKPEAATHRAALWRCLLSGLERFDATAAAEISAAENFEIVAWTYDFYGEHRDFALDTAAVDALLAQPGPSERDRAEANSMRRRLSRLVFLLGDRLPFLIPHIATQRMALHLRDLRRYVLNHNNIAQLVRQKLQQPLRAAAAAQRPVLLIAHSMGSVIAYESLWQLCRSEHSSARVHTLLTMGSPLGQRYIQKRIKGRVAIGIVRYPDNIGRWINLSAVGDMTALDPTLKNDFHAMITHGLIADIEDHEIYNWFRQNGELNAHSEYGYLVNPVTAEAVSDWWRSLIPAPDSAG